MPVLYFDNFRGFDKTFLPLMNVNFFVGENSTGKTSVLKLIRILSEPRFWFTMDFNSEEAELGYYSEIASLSSPNKRFFDIAILGDFRDKDEGISAIKLRFHNKDGVAAIKEISIIRKDINLQAVFEKTVVKYRHSKIDLQSINEANKLKYFKRWVSTNELENKSFKKFETNISFGGQPYYFILHEILIQIKQVQSSDSKISLSLPNFLHDVAWLAPIRTDPKRTYDSYKIAFNPDGTHAPYLLKKLLSKETSNKTREKIQGILKKFGSDSGLFEDIVIKNLGKTDTSPFELHILINGKPLKITNVGYGVSQILPLIVEVIARGNDSWFAIQQPEIHLHPKAQAAFGDFIFKSVLNDKKSFVIETHSDYTIDRFRLKLNKYSKNNTGGSIKSQIVFFKKANQNNELICVSISSYGVISEEQPVEFRDFFIKEQLELIQI